MISLRRRSIRFRLTAWHAAVLVVAVILFAVAINAVLDRRLNSNFDQGLLSTARAIQRTATVLTPRDGVPAAIDMPALDPFSIAGYFIQITLPNGQSIYRSEALGFRDLPLPDLAADLEAVRFDTVSIDGQRLRIIYAPLRLTSSDELLAVLIVAASTDPIDRALEEIRVAILIGAAIALVVAIAGGWFLAGRALRPVERMRRDVAEIALDGAAGITLAERVRDPETSDEISRLAQTFNELLDRLEAAFETERRFIADASHELRTPLTAIRGNVDVLLRQAAKSLSTRPDEQEALEDIHREASRMSRLLEDLLTLARASAGSLDDSAETPLISLDEPIMRAVRTARALAPDRAIELTIDAPVSVRANPDRIEQLALILLDNAVRHSEPPSPIAVVLARRGDRALVTVSDRGEGIAPEHLPHLFDRFYRIDAARSRLDGGAGLGLSIAQAIVQHAGGEIEVESRPGAGTTFTISLPIAPESAPVR